MKGDALFNHLRRLRRWRWREWFRTLVVTVAVGVTGVAVYAATLAKFTAPAPTLLLLDRHDRFLAECDSKPGAGSGYWPLRHLTPRVVAATLTLED